MIIRRARPDEAICLTALMLRAKAHWGYSPALMGVFQQEMAIGREDIAQNVVWVAEQKALLGFYHLRVLTEGGLHLEDLFTEPSAIGLGLGRRLFEHAVAQARELGYSAFTLVSDPHAEGHYLHMGAVRTGEQPSSLRGRMLPTMRYDIASQPAMNLQNPPNPVQ